MASERARSGACPDFGQHFRLLQHCLRRLLLLVGRIAVFAEDTLDEHAQLRADVFADGPVDGDVFAHRFDQLPRDGAEGFVAQDLDGAVVGFEGVVEGELVGGEPELLAAGACCAQLFGELDQLFDHLRGFDGAVLVFAHGLREQLGEGAGLDDVAFPALLDFAFEQLLQQLDGEVALRHVAHFGQEFVREDRDVRLLEAGRGEDVHHLVGDDRPRDDLADGEVQLLVRLGLPGRGFREHRAHGLEKGDVVGDAFRLFVRHRQREGLRQLGDGAQQPRLAVLLRQDVLLRGGQQ